MKPPTLPQISDSIPPGYLCYRYQLAVLLFALPAISPLFQQTLPDSADGLLHLYRVIALEQAWQLGVIFPRWLPNLAYGYGLPLFVFYAPFSYYPTGLIYRLTNNPILAFNSSMAIAMLLGSSGMFRFVKLYMGQQAALLASVAYLYAPYGLMTAYFRGSLPIVWAWALIPWVFWAFARLLQRNRWLDVALAASLCGLALLSHNISNLLFFPALMVYLGLSLLHLSRTTDHPAAQTTAIKIATALSLALGLAAFFLLPALLEKEFVQVERVITPPDFDYRSNFLSLSDLLSLPTAANTGLLNPTHTPMLGWPQLILAAIGSLFGIINRQRQQQQSKDTTSLLLFALLALSTTVSMTLPFSMIVWDSLPLLAFVQQPHRFLSLAAFCLALLCGVGGAYFPKRFRHGITLGGATLMVAFAMPLLYPRYLDPLPAELSLSGMLRYEQSIGAIGTTSFGEYLPMWVSQPPTEPPKPDNLSLSTRLDSAYLPEKTTIMASATPFNQLELTIDSPKPYSAIFHIFHFPGWQAIIDGQPVEIVPFSERGLISFSVPAGQHQLQLAFHETPLRQLANAISWGSFIVVGSIMIVGSISLTGFNERNRIPLSKGKDGGGQPRSAAYHVSSHRPTLLYLLLPLTLLLTKTLYLDHVDSPFKRVFDQQHVAQAQVDTQVDFGGQLTLLGYTLDRSTVASGETFGLTAYWQSPQSALVDYSILAHLVDASGRLYASQDNLHPGNLPMSRWQPWGFVQDPHAIPILTGTPPGDYFVVIGPYHPESWQRLPVLVGGQPAWGDVFPIPVEVIKPQRQPTLTELNIQWSQFRDLTPSLRFLGATPERETIRHNDFLRVALFWEAIQQPIIDYQINLRVLPEQGEPLQNDPTSPSHGRYPTTAWSPHERVRDQQALWIPADFADGLYRLELQLTTHDRQVISPWFEVGQLPMQ